MWMSSSSGADCALLLCSTIFCFVWCRCSYGFFSLLLCFFFLRFFLCLFRSKHAVTIVSQWPYRHIQIILRLYKSPAEVLMGFDVDCVCVGYDGKKALCLPRTHRALASRCNEVDMSRRSPSYEIRLAKYARRGVSFIPSFFLSITFSHPFLRFPSLIFASCSYLGFSFVLLPLLLSFSPTLFWPQILHNFPYSSPLQYPD